MMTHKLKIRDMGEGGVRERSNMAFKKVHLQSCSLPILIQLNVKL